LTLNNDIENIFYTKYLNSLPIIYKELFFENLNQEKVFALIEKRIIEFNEDHFNRVDEYFEDLTTYFIERNKTQFFQIIKELILSTENVIGLLKSDDFNLNEKIKLLEDMDQNIILSNVNVLTQIGILNRGNLQMSYSQTILENVLLKSEIEVKDKIEIFNSNSQKFAYEFVNSFLNSLKGNFSKLTRKGPTPTFKKTDYLTTFFLYLKDKDLISKIIDKGNKVKVTTYKK